MWTPFQISGRGKRGNGSRVSIFLSIGPTNLVCRRLIWEPVKNAGTHPQRLGLRKWKGGRQPDCKIPTSGAEIGVPRSFFF